MTITLLLFLHYLFALHATAAARRSSILVAQSVPTTGINDFCGTPIWFFPFSPDGGPPRDFHFDQIQEYDEVGTGSMLTRDNCNHDAVLATYSNPGFNALRGWPDPHPNVQNIPLNQLSTVVGLNGARGSLPTIDNASPLEPHLVSTNHPITLGDWVAARGSVVIACSKDRGSSTVEFEFKHLIPNGVYTMFALYRTPAGGLSPPVPLGGHPNVFVADARGYATFSRSFAHCLLDPVDDGHELLYMEANYRVDGVPQGVVTSVTTHVADFDVDEDGNAAFSSALSLGVVKANHLLFPVHKDIEENEEVATLLENCRRGSKRRL